MRPAALGREEGQVSVGDVAADQQARASTGRCAHRRVPRHRDRLVRNTPGRAVARWLPIDSGSTGIRNCNARGHPTTYTYV